MLNFGSDFEVEVLSIGQCHDFLCLVVFLKFIDVDNVSALSQPRYACNVCLFTISDGKEYFSFCKIEIVGKQFLI